ncbi:MAG: hypothetical protein ABIH19_00390 [Candidatus Omnitrophota bacterium]
MIKKNITCYPLFAISILFFVLTSAHAEKITVFYTGETHGMIYPCSCPVEPDGGVARRASLIKGLKKKYPDSLIFDSGNFFAGGTFDDYTQNSELDEKRSLINLRAMELIGYDAVGVSAAEFNFTEELFEENISKTNIKFLSCNLKSAKILPYIIKEISGIKFGTIGVTPNSLQRKLKKIAIVEPVAAVLQAEADLREKGIDFIIVLSTLNSSQNLDLIKSAKGIDILIAGNEGGHPGEKPYEKIENTLVLYPNWQGRRLGKAELTIKNGDLTDYEIEELRLSDKIQDDPDILAILPDCFSDNNCKREGSVGTCKNTGTLDSKCEFSKANKVSLLVITPKECPVCDTENVVNFLKRSFPGLEISYLYYPGKKAESLIKNFSLTGLPAYFLGEEVQEEKIFANIKKDLRKIDKYYMLEPKFIGVSYLLDRKESKGKLDLFLSLYNKDASELLKVIEEFRPEIHFLAGEENGSFGAINGPVEAEDYLRALCIQEYYPERFWNYISCRADNFHSSWWDDCAAGLDLDKVKACAKSDEGVKLLRKNISLNQELEVMFGPTYLANNYLIFGSKGVPSKEELKKILER